MSDDIPYANANTSNANTSDEISLRDLYLILRRGLPLIVIVALLAGAVAFVLSSVLPKRYAAEATVMLTPLPINARGADSFTLNLRSDVSFETYNALAFSRSVLAAALDRVDLDPPPSVQELRNNGRLTKLVGPQRPDQIAPLTVSHTVTATDPEVAAALANAWAQATLATAQQTMLASLTPLQESTARETAELATELEQLEAAWEAFQADDESDILTAQLTSLARRTASGEEQLDDLDRRLGASLARQELLRAQLEMLRAQQESAATNALTPAAQLELLQASGIVSEEIAPQLAAVLERQPAADGALEHDLVVLLVRSELQFQASESAGLTAERDTLRQQLQRFRDEAATLRQQLARLEQERTRLARDLQSVRTAYADVSALEPIFSYLAELAPTTARVLSEASVPTHPVGPRRTLNTALAVVLAAMATLLLVFLREAIMPPAATSSATPMPTQRAASNEPQRPESA